MNVTFCCWSQLLVQFLVSKYNIHAAIRALWIRRPNSETVRRIQDASADWERPCSRLILRGHRRASVIRIYQDIRAGSSWYGFRPNANAAMEGCQTAPWQHDLQDLMHRMTEQFLTAWRESTLGQNRQLMG